MTTVAALAARKVRLVFFNFLLLNKGYGLIVGDFEPLATPGVGAGQEIIHPHQVISGLGELSPIQIVGPWGKGFFLGASQPANREFGQLTASWTGIGGFLGNGGFAVKVSLVHDFAPGK
jgi:hypothetical protein